MRWISDISWRLRAIFDAPDPPLIAPEGSRPPPRTEDYESSAAFAAAVAEHWYPSEDPCHDTRCFSSPFSGHVESSSTFLAHADPEKYTFHNPEGFKGGPFPSVKRSDDGQA